MQKKTWPNSRLPQVFDALWFPSHFSSKNKRKKTTCRRLIGLKPPRDSSFYDIVLDYR